LRLASATPITIAVFCRSPCCPMRPSIASSLPSRKPLLVRKGLGPRPLGNLRPCKEPMDLHTGGIILTLFGFPKQSQVDLGSSFGGRASWPMGKDASHRSGLVVRTMQGCRGQAYTALPPLNVRRMPRLAALGVWDLIGFSRFSLPHLAVDAGSIRCPSAAWMGANRVSGDPGSVGRRWNVARLSLRETYGFVIRPVGPYSAGCGPSQNQCQFEARFDSQKQKKKLLV